MRPALRQPVTALTALAALSGCAGQGEGLATPPRDKPAMLTAQVATPGEDKLGTARISTKSGEILILEPDGSVTTMQLDSPAGRDVFEVTQAQIAGLGFAGAITDIPVNAPKGPTAQERALAEFAARTGPALPVWRDGAAPVPADFIGVQVGPLQPGRDNNLVEVVANLRQGVDADIAFSYATCALADWAKQTGTPYARHIRTLQEAREGRLLVGSVFTLSDSRPLGLQVMETNETLRECEARGIPAERRGTVENG